MFKDKEFVLHLIGLIVLTALAVFFGILEAVYNKEITDVGLIIGLIGSLVGVRSLSRIGRDQKNDKTE